MPASPSPATAPPSVVLLSCQTQRFGTTADCCGRNGAANLLAFLQLEIEAQGLTPWVMVRESPCFGHCSQGPILRWVGGEIYSRMTKQGVLDLVNSIRCWLEEQGVDLSARPPDDPQDGGKAAFLLPPI